MAAQADQNNEIVGNYRKTHGRHNKSAPGRLLQKAAAVTTGQGADGQDELQDQGPIQAQTGYKPAHDRIQLGAAQPENAGSGYRIEKLQDGR